MTVWQRRRCRPVSGCTCIVTHPHISNVFLSLQYPSLLAAVLGELNQFSGRVVVLPSGKSRFLSLGGPKMIAAPDTFDTFCSHGLIIVAEVPPSHCNAGLWILWPAARRRSWKAGAGRQSTKGMIKGILLSLLVTMLLIFLT